MNVTEHNRPSASASTTTVTPIVFVVNGDASVRESLASLVRSAGWHPKLSSSAQEFLSLPRIHAPCCLLLAVDLPDLSGLDLQQRISDRTDIDDGQSHEGRCSRVPDKTVLQRRHEECYAGRHRAEPCRT
jgi:CheY-like chemotaxis protein